MNSIHQIASQPLTKQIEVAIEQGFVSLPPLDALTIEILELIDDKERADTRKAAKLVKKDLAMTATLLKLANSAAFGGLNPVSELQPAIARLGLQQLRSAVVALKVKKLYQSNDPERRALARTVWEHSLAVATGARYLTKLTGGDADEAFLAGLLHDVGMFLVLSGIDSLELGGLEVCATPFLIEELMDTAHAELGFKTLVAWHLPESTCRAVLRHHDETAALEDMLVVRVQAADIIAKKLGLHLKPEPDLDLNEVAAIERLQLTEVEQAALLVDLEDEIAETKALRFD